jgi:hypothetical protein
MKKGVIVEIRGNQKIILSPGGRFYIAPLKKGDVIGGIAPIPAFKKKLAALTVTAAFILAAAVGGYYTADEINSTVAETLVQVQINPSVEFLINGKGKVLSSAPLNEDAAVLTVDRDFCGLNIVEAARSVADLSVSCGFMNPDAEYYPVFIYTLNDNSRKQDRISAEIRNGLERYFSEKFVKAIIIENGFSVRAEGLSSLFGMNARKLKAVYQVSSIKSGLGDPRSLSEILKDYKGTSVKELCNIIRQAHIRYGQSLNAQKKEILINQKRQFISNNDYGNVFVSREYQLDYNNWLQRKNYFESNFLGGMEIAYSPLYANA